MKLGVWNLEILVNDRPLREYVIPDSVLGVSVSNALKSYVLEGTQKKFCDSATFVAVPAPGTYYSLKIFPNTTDITAKVFVDGTNDGFYTRKGSSHVIMKGFYNRDASKLYNFVFDKTEWIESNISQRTEFGGFGIISVYFYKIKKSYESRFNYNSNKTFEKVKVPESKKCFDVAVTTKFSEGSESYNSRHWEIVKTEDEPLAVLHINYRSADWFFFKGITIQNNPTVVNTFNTSNEIEDVKPIIVDTKNEVIKVENDNSKEIITINDTNENPSVIHVRKKKRRYQEIIVLLDSDDDEVMELD
ncbi:hypothetical protein C1645_781831 [Glomus cerebriforme]|uniref:Uncharacterized protein n=1 Tax=Glomus cerebriforme TaxID=658196 RepID=A0A397SHE2_9GLOM|nr:hypothetical protein C1645_781831 [Glomus cerebriforme]